MSDFDTLGDGTGLIGTDSWLGPFAGRLAERQSRYKQALARLAPTGGLLGQISQGHHYFGFNRGEFHGKPGVWYREWAPAALQLRVIGDFNNWDRWSTPMVRDEFGVWGLFFPDDKFATKLVHGSHVKVHVVGEDSRGTDRIPAYIRRVVQDDRTKDWAGVYWNPPEPHVFRNSLPDRKAGLRIYEAHVGMSQEEPKVGTYVEFTRDVLPRIKELGYNAVQLMAVMEHPYYGSFGYHVSSFFAVSSRSGTPEELKELIDTAHGMGIRVLLDLIHSHAVKNTLEGLGGFDGSDHQYFHAGPRGYHPAWDSYLFDYTRYEVQRLLLSNIRYWLEDFRFDGFRFDGVTSMLYLDHGLSRTFSSYDDYFGDNIDEDAVVYLKMANQLAHTLNPRAITIAEDVSGMPGMARPVSEGGIGFDYRLAMGVPDYWIKILKEKRDEEWELGMLVHTLLNRRHAEKHIGYAESHDQALVGDKTLAFRLMDKDMYWHMDRSGHTPIIDRGLSLHKLIRLITFTLAGEAYLNFMGNEFGHPEWIDFPREGNGWSMQYARRQWSLADNPQLHYAGLKRFDAEMLQLDEKFHVLEDPLIEELMVHEENKLVVYRRGPLVFAFNFHPTRSYPDLRIPVPDPTDYVLILDTDESRFDGFARVAPGMAYPYEKVPTHQRQQSIRMYLPNRSAQVLAPAKIKGGLGSNRRNAQQR
jgi:1,4-alpha-glucan branching enzyme